MSVARYVFTDLGIVASRDSLLLQLRSHPRLYEFLSCVHDQDVREVYRLLREGEHARPKCCPTLACFSRSTVLPKAAVRDCPRRTSQGVANPADRWCGAGISPSTVQRMFQLFTNDGRVPDVFIDRAYQIWVDGITWRAHVARASLTR